MGKLFGTDGIRGTVNRYPINAETALKIGQSIAYWCGKNNRERAIFVGKDPRLSGDMLAHALISGICSMGIDAQYAGTLPTPAVARLTYQNHCSAGIMVSASHNPYTDNGIKLFNEDGYKLSQADEAEIEGLILNEDFSETGRKTGRTIILDDATDRYIDFLRPVLPITVSLNGLKIVTDCSNGATYKVAPALFQRLGATVIPIFNEPDGVNINSDCGSQHPDALIKTVLETGADIGLAFDGDGDRLIAVDEKGERISGDKIIAICGKLLKEKGELKNNLIVTTVMSNIGLQIALQNMQIKLLMTDVGDRNVMETMLASGSILGGEDSGHTIFLNHHTTGDGILTAIKLIEAMKHEGKPLSDLAGIMTVFPQILINVPVKKQINLNEDKHINAVITEAEQKLGKKGRVLVRYSGTRPLCRVMVEGPTEGETRTLAEQIVRVIKEKMA